MIQAQLSTATSSTPFFTDKKKNVAATAAAVIGSRGEEAEKLFN